MNFLKSGNWAIKVQGQIIAYYFYRPKFQIYFKTLDFFLVNYNNLLKNNICIFKTFHNTLNQKNVGLNESKILIEKPFIFILSLSASKTCNAPVCPLQVNLSNLSFTFNTLLDTACLK